MHILVMTNQRVLRNHPQCKSQLQQLLIVVEAKSSRTVITSLISLSLPNCPALLYYGSVPRKMEPQNNLLPWLPAPGHKNLHSPFSSKCQITRQLLCPLSVLCTDQTSQKKSAQRLGPLQSFSKPIAPMRRSSNQRRCTSRLFPPYHFFLHPDIA
jgi:hypothetical protein